MKSEFIGVAHGTIIELNEHAGLPEGQAVRVTIEPADSDSQGHEANLRDALRRAAGAWTGDAEDLDCYLEWNRQQRKGTRQQVGE